MMQTQIDLLLMLYKLAFHVIQAHIDLMLREELFVKALKSKLEVRH